MSSNRIIKLSIAGALLLFGLALPYLGASTFVLSMACTILIAAILAASVNFLAGEAGMVSLGHAGIAAASSYAVGWASAQGHGHGTQLILAIVLTLGISLIYGLLSMRTSGIYFLMVTLAVGMLIYGLAFRLSSVTAGENGISKVYRPEWMRETWIYYYVVLIAFVLATAALFLITKSAFGAGMRGLRDSESRMRSLGYNVPLYRLGAFMFSGTIAGLAGLLAVWHTSFVSPSSAGVERSVSIIIMVILGGVGTVSGPLIGASVVMLVENVLSSHVVRWPTILGLIFIVTVLFARQGIAGSFAKFRRHRSRKTAPPPEEELHESALTPEKTDSK